MPKLNDELVACWLSYNFLVYVTMLQLHQGRRGYRASRFDKDFNQGHDVSDVTLGMYPY